jgi:hypothetical protein
MLAPKMSLVLHLKQGYSNAFYSYESQVKYYLLGGMSSKEINKNIFPLILYTKFSGPNG